MKLPQDPPLVATILPGLGPGWLSEFVSTGLLSSLVDTDYLHWDDLRRRPLPPGVESHKIWWLLLTVRRQLALRELPLRDVSGAPLRYAPVDPVLELLHRLDRDAGGRIAFQEQVTDPHTRDRYIVSSLMEEAITSSQLEGAATTRRVAREMLRSGRAPRSHGERMISNNFAAIQRIREVQDEPLTPELVLELHLCLTEGTLRDPDAEGRLRTTDDVTVRDIDDRVLHQPPAAVELPERLQRLCDFANGETSGSFVHPISRAILIHFALAYDHPFDDGNGRTARALFYWSMLHEGYWLTEFLSISRLLKAAPAQYARAFLLTESDGNDATYFLLHQLRTLERAVRELEKWLERKVAQRRATERRLRAVNGLNHRQVALLGHALKHPVAEYSFESHRGSHNVVYQTARADLLQLTDLGLLIKRKRGRRLYFLAAPELESRLQGLGA